MKKTTSNFWSRFLSDRIFFTTLLQIAVPISIQNLLINSLSFADTVMIGRLGAAEIASVGLGNQIFFMYILVMFGVGSGGAIFVAQFWGKQDIRGIRKAQGFCLVLSAAAGILFALASFIIPETLLRLFTPDPEVIKLGAVYQRITAVSYLFSAVSFTYSIVLRSVEQARLPLYVTVVSLVFNVILNYLFIFGIGIFPAMGVAGAALGTTISRGIEVTVMLCLVYRRRGNGEISPAAASVKELLGFGSGFVKKYFRTALPVIMNEIAWGGGMTVYKAIYARVGTEALASINIAETVINMLFVFLLGSGNATAAMVGKVIGQGDREKALEFGQRFMIIATLIGIAVSTGIVILARPVTMLFNVSDYVKQTATLVMLVTAIWIPFKAVTTHLIVGVFRGGGDTRFGLMLDLLGVWAIGLPITFFGGLHLGLAVPLVYFLAAVEELFKTAFGLPRLFTGKWINDLTGHEGISGIVE